MSGYFPWAVATGAIGMSQTNRATRILGSSVETIANDIIDRRTNEKVEQWVQQLEEREKE
jgi:hypothetical protein